jgi:hypothetical protein
MSMSNGYGKILEIFQIAQRTMTKEKYEEMECLDGDVEHILLSLAEVSTSLGCVAADIKNTVLSIEDMPSVLFLLASVAEYALILNHVNSSSVWCAENYDEARRLCPLQIKANEPESERSAA